MPKRAPTHRPHARTVAAPSAPQTKRASPTKRGYGRKWQKLRDVYASQHPLCAVCLREGIVKPMHDVDHIVPRAKGGKDEWSNLQSLCLSCHSRKTATEDTNFARRRKVNVNL